MALWIQHELIKDLDGRIKFWKASEEGLEHYQLGVWLDGPDSELDSVDRVEYILHPTFERSIVVSNYRANKFKISFWAWGRFIIRANIFFKMGRQTNMQYFLDFELPDDDGTNYVRILSTKVG